MTHHFSLSELSLRRQHFEDDAVGFGELQRAPVEEEEAAARGSTQQPADRGGGGGGGEHI